MIRPEYETFVGFWVAKVCEGGFEFSGVGKTEVEAFEKLREKLQQASQKGEVATKIRFRLAR